MVASNPLLCSFLPKILFQAIDGIGQGMIGCCLGTRSLLVVGYLVEEANDVLQEAISPGFGQGADLLAHLLGHFTHFLIALAGKFLSFLFQSFDQFLQGEVALVGELAFYVTYLVSRFVKLASHLVLLFLGSWKGFVK